MVKLWSAIKRYFSLTQKPKVSDRAAYITEQELVDAPWATFEVRGFENDGRIKVEFNWNAAFIRRIKDFGFQAETEEDSVQLFFYTSQMRPTQLSGGDDPVQSSEHPQLSSQQNVLRT